MTGRIAALIRHGDYHQLANTPSAHQPFPLNRQGRGHAGQAAGILRREAARNGWEPYASIDCSRMLRAWQTARIIADQLTDLTATAPLLEEFDALAERGLGAGANLTVAEIERVIGLDPRHPEPPENWKADSHYRLPLQGAESLLEAGRRVAAHIDSRMAALPGPGLKVFVGHGAAFRHAAHHLGVLQFDDIAKLSMFHGRPVFIQYHAPGVWRHVAGEWKVRDRYSRAMD